MDPVNEDPAEVAKRFIWVSDITFLVCSEWGFEKLMQITETRNEGETILTIDEIASGSIPAFSPGDCANHLYVE